MKQHPKPQRGIPWSAVALATALATLNSSSAATIAELEPTIVSALRFLQAGDSVTSAVTTLRPDDFIDQGVFQLRDALNKSPGVIATSTAGQTGAVSSLLIRGTVTADSLMVIDGVRINGAGNQLGSFFAGSRSQGLGSLEILRGPQSAIHGGESIGGVIWAETPRGRGEASSSLFLEAGSFDTLSSFGAHQGQVGSLSYYLSAGHESTDNDAPNNSFHQTGTALRLENSVGGSWDIGTTFRAVDNTYNNAGSSEDEFEAVLVTLYANGQLNDRWAMRTTLGYYDEYFDSVYSSGTIDSSLDTFSLSNEHQIVINDELRLFVGGFYHRDSYSSSNAFPDPMDPFFSSAAVDADRYGLYSSAEWDAMEHLTATASLRWEDYQSHGSELTWRLGSVYRIEESGTRIRGSIGTAFRAPTYLDLYYSNNLGQFGNPNLESQSSLGWDFGIEQSIGKNHSLELIWFRNLVENAINSSAFPSPFNIPGTTATQGLEMGWLGSWRDGDIRSRLAWTWLDKSLKDQPRNATTATVSWHTNSKLTLGAGATHLSTHSWGGNELAAYTVTRAFASYALTEEIKIHARVENILDEEYELSNFSGTVIPGAGTGIYAGVTIDW